jgi:hypothetical protein
MSTLPERAAAHTGDQAVNTPPRHIDLAGSPPHDAKTRSPSDAGAGS